MHSTKQLIGYIHLEVQGPSPISSKGRARYMLIFIDDYLTKVWIYFLKHKSEVFNRVKKFKALIEKHSVNKFSALGSITTWSSIEKILPIFAREKWFWDTT